MTICSRCRDYIPAFDGADECLNTDCPHRPLNLEPDDDLSDVAEGACSSPRGHEWAYTGTAYGGDDSRWMGEGRSYCIHCGIDGDA